MIRLEHNVETGEITEITLTAEELEEVEKAQEENAVAEATRQAEADAKAAQRQALLERLGITESEAQLLLGGNK